MTDTDIGRELCEKIRAVFNSRIAGDTTIAAIRKKVEDGRATMNDMSVYSRQLGIRLRQAIESTIRPEDLPDETMYQNIAHSILDPLLRENYDEINRICAETQRELDRKARIGLTPQAAEYPAERVVAASFGAAAKELASDAIKVLGRTSENITASASDEYMKTNAEYRSNAGLDAYIVRTDGAGCCKWCAALAGKFKYPDDIPDDVFRRHDNCTCDVSYICDKGRQNVHTKKWANKPRKIEYEKPAKRTRTEAKAKESEILAQRRLTYGEKSGIINVEIDELTPCLRDNKTGELVQTEVKKVTNRSELANCTEKNGWDFPWNKAPRDAEVYSLRVKGSSEIEGLIALKKEPENAAVYLYWGNAAPHNQITETNAKKKYNGVGGHLFAIAADISVKEGYGGFMYADAANKELYELFVNEYGATPIPTHNNPYRFFFDGKATKRILDTYTFDRR